MGNPQIPLLDGSSKGLALLILRAIGDLIRRLRDMGVTVLLAEQNMHFCLGNASQAVIIDKCHVIYRDSNETLKADNEVRSRYLTV
ncbi:MAG: hypothetical protein V1267_03650 [Alphaproteobacteria bacterium]|jgi:branched-chain amino acid transport system ATP-binding protein|nr:hypothetical protein [Alphaproteobacteria bacterium]|tara:strand:+ start:263 stop:520 length:258 start_codon:yes stop_codon:yes gene_type:complete